MVWASATAVRSVRWWSAGACFRP